MPTAVIAVGGSVLAIAMIVGSVLGWKAWRRRRRRARTGVGKSLGNRGAVWTTLKRERIDFVYYHPDKRIRVKTAQIVGPRGCIVRGERLTEFSRDPFILPVNNHWPSDHKGVFVTFRIRH